MSGVRPATGGGGTDGAPAGRSLRAMEPFDPLFYQAPADDAKFRIFKSN